MKIGIAFVCAALIILGASQAALFHRMSVLEQAASARPATDDSFDRRLAAMKRTVESLASDVRKKKKVPAPSAKENPAPAVPSPPASASAKEAETASDEATNEKMTDEKTSTGALPPALASRRQVLDEIRGRLGALDRNADLQVSLEEFDGDVRDFLHIDRNSSGRISAEELERAIEVEDDALRRVASADKDGDGLVSPGEFKGSSRRFRYLDENLDGRIAPEEYVTSQRRLRERMDSDDLDDDHKLSKAEFAGSAAKFEKFDENKDGFIDRDELKEILLQGYDR